MDWYAELDRCNNLEELENITKGCKKCHLCEKAKQVVFGKGSYNAPVMLVGEAPGADAVSYTHLDVYKRQARGCSRRQWPWIRRL